MADMFSIEKRSEIMSKIQSKNTKIETTVRSWLFNNGFRFRKNDARFPGKPDVVLPKYKTVIFVNGCFWHSHEGCKYAYMPKTRVDYWKSKLEKNKKRDIRNRELILGMGWNVIDVWECELRKNPLERLESLMDQVRSGKK